MALPNLITQQLAALDEEAGKIARLRAQLTKLKAMMDRGDKPEMADWLTTLEYMTMYDKYFTPKTEVSRNHRQSASSNLDISAGPNS